MLHPPAYVDARRLDQARGVRVARRILRVSRSVQVLQRALLDAVASGRPLDQVAVLLCAEVERIVQGITCSVLAVGAGGVGVLAGPALARMVVDGQGEQAALEAVAHAPCDAYRPVAAAGSGTWWSTRVEGRDGRVIGAIVFGNHTARRPSASERRIADACAGLVALAIEHAGLWGRLKETNERFDVALTHMSQGLCFFDGNRRLIVANRRFSEIYGLGPDSIAPGTSLEEIVRMRVAVGSGPAMVADDYLEWRGALQVRDTPTDTVVALESGRVIAIHHRPMPDRGWVATHEDITERRRAEQQVEHMARHDVLTGLPNRMLFRERMEQALSVSPEEQDCALLCLDLDRFKAVNDTLGHPAGDALLRIAADRIRACVRDGDTPARLGGDEFAVLLVGVKGPEAAGEVAQRLIASLSEPFDIEGHGAVVGASAGIALTSRDGTTPERLLKSADTALYRAKLDQRGTVRFYEPGMELRMQARAALERDLRQAVQDDAFDLAFQPMMDLESDRVAGFEALLRWKHAERGQVEPSSFIPVAEETGLIVALGAWVLRTACMEAARWPESVKLAVNLSAVQFATPGLVQTVAHALSLARMAPARLELEITESVLLKNSEETLTTLHQLRALGVRVSLDDFGTGYSSLSYLRSFPFDRIKIDQSFIQDLSDEKDSVAITRAIVGLGRSLGIATTAEGVETYGQLDHLRREGCTEVQGYLFSRPVPAAAARAMLDAGAHVGGQIKTSRLSVA